MKVEVQNKNLETVLNIKLDGSEFAPYLDKAFKKEVKNVESDGFRKGKMPKAIFLKKYGVESLYNEAINFAMADSYSKAVVDNQVNGVAFPKIDVKNVSEEDGLEFEAVVAVAPEFKDLDEDKIKIEKASTDVTDDEINAELEKIVAQETELVVTDKAAENGDTVVIDFEGFKDGVAFEGGKGNSYPLELGSNSFIPGFEEQLVGSKAGDDVVVTVTFPESYQVADLAGAEAKFECKVHEVKSKETPELNDELVKSLGIENVSTVNDLKENKKDELEKAKKDNIENSQREMTLNSVDAYAKTIDLEIHDDHVSEEVKAITDNFQQQNNVSLSEYAKIIGKDEKEINEEVKQTAIDSIKRRTVLDALALKHKIDVTEEDIDSEIQKLADMYKVDLEIIKQSVAGELSQIKAMIKDQKVLDKLSK